MTYGDDAVGAVQAPGQGTVDLPSPVPSSPDPLRGRTAAWGETLERALGRDPEQQHLVAMCRCGNFRAEGTVTEVLEAQRQHLREDHGIRRAPARARRRQDGRRRNGPTAAVHAARRKTMGERRERNVAGAIPILLEELAKRPLRKGEMMDIVLAAGLPRATFKYAFEQLQAEDKIRQTNDRHTAPWTVVA